MASRYDQPSTEPDYDRYETKPLDAADEPRDGEPFDPPVDPAEHAAHALHDAIATMRVQLAQVTDVARAIQVKLLIHQAWEQLDKLDFVALDKISECMERRR